ncbi:hypothetical protein BH23ACI1_BH23ACI1_23010 [soil metagenome]
MAAAALGRQGGLARARRLSADERRRVASLGGQARRRSIEVAARIERNLQYAAAVRDLAGGTATVARVTRLRTRLPGIYPGRD